MTNEKHFVFTAVAKCIVWFKIEYNFIVHQGEKCLAQLKIFL